MKRSLCAMAVALGALMAHGQVPEIHSISPSAAASGAVVRIFGDQFDNNPTNNRVHFGGVNARVRRSWVSELEVEVPPSVQPGVVTVSVDNKLAISSTPFLPLFAPLGVAHPVYLQRVKFAGGSNPAAVDLDNDGDLELIVAKRDRLEVYQYTGSEPLLSEGSFTLVQSATGFASTASIRAMDLEGNGKFDLLVTSSNNTAYLALNRYQSSEAGTRWIERYQGMPGSVTAEFFDSDRDGTPDLFLWNGTSVNYHRGIPFLGGGHGVYESGRPILPIGGGTVRGMAVGDLNRDGHGDIALLGATEITIRPGNSRRGDTSFSPPVSFTLPGMSLNALQMVDVQGDGRVDLVAFNTATRYCEVYWNRNKGGHLEPEDFERVILSPHEISATLVPRFIDLDGDALPELIFRSRSYHRNESALLGDVIFGGTFLRTNAWNVSFPSTVGLFSADLNRDGKPEIITSDGTIYQNISAIAPVIIALEQSRPGTLQLVVAGSPSQTVSLQSSANLVSWSNAGSIRVGESGTGTMEMAATARVRFYILTPDQ